MTTGRINQVTPCSGTRPAGCLCETTPWPISHTIHHLRLGRRRHSANQCPELRYHLISALPDKVALLLPVTNFVSTMSKVRELSLIYGRAVKTESVNHLQSAEDTRLKQMEEALHDCTEQLTALTRRQEPPRCFTCGKPGHMARNCRTRWM